MQVNSISSSFNTAPSVTADAALQIGVPGTLRARFFGTTSNSAAVVSFVDESHLQGPVASQTLDYPGPEFLYMTKSQGGGGQKATLLCSVNAWFWASIPTSPLTEAEAQTFTFGGMYGISTYPVQHNVNQLTAGWGAGPSGLLNTQNINSACAALNNTLTQASQSPTGTEPRQQYAGRIFGTYKADATASAPPTFNSTNCAARDFPNDLSSYERICTNLEPSGFGRPNSCNPQGGLGSGVTASVIQTKDGANTTCTTLSFTSGTRLSSYSKC
jgi:hypothetical protein